MLYHHRKNKDKDEVAVAGVITSQEQVGRMTSYLTLNDVEGEVDVDVDVDGEGEGEVE